MVRYARNGLAGAGRVFVAPMQRFAHRLEPASVQLAFNTINTIRHLPRDEDHRAHLDEMARVLAPGGIYVVGISLSAYGREAVTEDVWEGRRGRCRVHQVVQYLPPDREERIEEVLTHLTIQRPSGTEHRDHRYGLRSFNRKQWRKLLLSSPLAVVETCSDRGRPMQDHDGNYFLYVLRRR
jgi:hypothetical protein